MAQTHPAFDTSGVSPEFRDAATGQIKFERFREKLWGRYLPLAAQLGTFGYSVFALSAFVSPLISAGLFCVLVMASTYHVKHRDRIKEIMKDEPEIVGACLDNAATTVDKVGEKVSFLHKHPRLFDDIRRLAHRAGLKKPLVVLFQTAEGDQKAAYAAALSDETTKGNFLFLNCRILEILDRHELNAVIGHEMTHMKEDSGLKKGLPSCLSFIHLLPFLGSVFIDFFDPTVLADIGMKAASITAGMRAFFVTGALGFIAVHLIDKIQCRHAELVADRGSALITGRPDDMAAALKKIKQYNDGKEHSGFSWLKKLPFLQKALQQGERALSNAVEWALAWTVGTHPPIRYRIKQLRRFKEKHPVAAVQPGKSSQENRFLTCSYDYNSHLREKFDKKAANSASAPIAVFAWAPPAAAKHIK